MEIHVNSMHTQEVVSAVRKAKEAALASQLKEPVMLWGSVRDTQVAAREHTQSHILMMNDSTEHITSTSMEAFQVRETLPCAKTSQGRKLRWALMYSSKEYTFWMGGTASWESGGCS